MYMLGLLTVDYSRCTFLPIVRFYRFKSPGLTAGAFLWAEFRRYCGGRPHHQT